MIHLRNWQQECTSQAIESYTNGQSDFLAIATPGAGKTIMAASVARSLFDRDLIDLVVCFVPSLTVALGFGEDLRLLTGRTMDGELGAAGRVLTYQNLGFLKPTFWDLFNRHRVFVIFDEIHHCGGRDDTATNQWGSAILQQVKNSAQYTLLLSGTPWRSDKLPVTLATYCNDNGRLVCDYSYGLQRAIDDNVCRIPQIIAIDNNEIQLQDDDGKTQHYDSFDALLGVTRLSFQLLLENDELLKYCLGTAISKLRWVRKRNPQAAGLIVASSIFHARYIATLMANNFGESTVVVTHKTPNSTQLITHFKTSVEQWIISVGMISEGTNIPRLQVCCYLTRIKTELYFRQVLGRILRHQGETLKKAYLYMLAEKNLVEYAKRIETDLPKERAVFQLDQGPMAPLEHITPVNSVENNVGIAKPIVYDDIFNEFGSESAEIDSKYSLPAIPKIQLSWSGTFYEQLLTLQNSFRTR